MKSKLTRFIAILIVLGMIVSPISAQSTPPTGSRLPVVDRSTLLSKPEAEGPVQKFTQETAVESYEVNGKDPVRFVVILPDKPLATYKGEVAGLAATAPSVTGAKLNVKSPESQAYLKYLQAQQSAYLTTASNVLGYTPKVLFQYQYGTNGFSMMLTPAEAELLAAQTGAKVLRAPIEHPETDEGPSLIGAPAIWDGETSSGVETFGEGVLVGIIDTGINFDHPSFSATPEDGYVYEWTGDYLGVCAPAGDPAYATACNDKVVGAFTYVAGDPVETSTPEDSEGHGSHTASTVAGNIVEVEFQGVTTTISGVAPHAQIIAFDVCVPEEPNGACYGDATVAAVDDAILNGVDVLNYSISGGANPYGDPVELAFLAATEAGIFVSTSAGNAGDTTGESSVAHRSPWVSTVAATSHGRIFANAVDITGPIPVPPELTGLGAVQAGPLLAADLVNLPIKYDPANVNGCAAFAPGFFDGAFALVQRGTCNFSVKEANAYAAGAEYVLIFNSRTGAPAGMAGIVTGAAMISMEDGLAIKAWIDANPTATATMHADTRWIYNANYEDIVAGFSSYGPNTTFDVLKPDITGPGVSILAAVADGTIAPSSEYEIELYQGTSMSSPHNAGAAALMVALHPDWTPMEIRSAMMMTAEDGLRADRFTIEGVIRPATPQDEGAGRIALENAAMVGLVMDETIENFEAADPTLDGTPASLNLASLYSSKCVGECTWTRTFKSVANLPATYTVEAPAWVTVTPNEFTIPAGGTQVVTFAADVAALETDVWAFASIEFLTDSTFAAGDPVVVLTQDFTEATFPPTGWTIFDIDTGDTTPSNWARATDYFSSSPASAKHKYDCTQEQEGWIVTPQITVPADGNTSLSFKQRGNFVTDLFYHGIMVSTGSGDPTAGAFVELAVPPAPTEDAWSATPVSVDLSAYAGQSIYLAFKYIGDCADDWWIDDVAVTNLQAGEPIADVHIPLAVMPATGNLPGLAKFETHRDAGGDTLTDLVAVEITDLTVDKYGWVKGEKNEFQLAQDPTNGDAFDDVNQNWYTVVPMADGAARLVAEITASTALDVDLFWGFDLNFDGMPSEDELYGSSATATAFEYLTKWGFPVPFYDVWIMVQNWEGSGAALDDITLTVGLVPYAPADPENMTIVGPATNPAGEPFSMDVLWHDIDTEVGDRLYGMIDVYADADYATPIGLAQLDVVRLEDDVVKTADVTEAAIGDTITYTIEVTNFSNTDTLYTIEDVLPEGVTYVPDSVTGGATYDAGTNAISWEGTVAAGAWKYLSTTSAEDAACSLAILADGDPTDAYLDLKTTSYGFSTSSSIYGDSKWYGTFSSYPPFNYYGVDYTGMEFTDDGYAGFAFEDVDYNNQELPNALDPNNVLAMLWDDFVIQYDAATNKGVTMVGDSSTFAVIEYDDLYFWGGDTSVTLDVEVGYFLQPDDAPGAYEIVYAFDNIHPDLLAEATATIGLENADGTAGTLISYNDPALSIEDGSAICFDWKYIPAESKVITFQVTVDEDAEHGLLVNQALHDNDQVGTVEEAAEAFVEIGSLPVAVDDNYSVVEDTTLNVSVSSGVLANDSDADSDPLTSILVDDVTFGSLTLNSDGSFEYTPMTDFTGIDTFTYVANDSYMNSGLATVTINVTPVNDAPEAVDDEYSMIEDGLLEVATPGVLFNDIEVDGDNTVAALVTNVEHGSLMLMGDGSFTYQPEPDFFGTDTFVYSLITYPAIQNMWTDEATVTITVEPVNDAPVLDLIGDKEVDELVELTFTATAADIEMPDQTLTFSLTGNPDGAVIDPETGVFTWTPTEEQGPGEFTLTVKVCDDDVDTPLCDEEEITITVAEVNVAPILDPIGNKTVVVGEILTFTATATDADLPAQTLAFSLVDAPIGALIDPATGEFTWDTTDVLPGDFVIDVCVSDGISTICETITVTVTEVPDPMPFKIFLPLVLK